MYIMGFKWISCSAFVGFDVVCPAGDEFQEPGRYGAFEGHQELTVVGSIRPSGGIQTRESQTGHHYNPSC